MLLLACAVAKQELSDLDIPSLKERIQQGDSMLLYFYSKGCHYCKRYQQVFDIVAQGKVSGDPAMTYHSIDVDRCNELTARFLVVRIPTLIHAVSGKLYNMNEHRLDISEYFSEQRWLKMKPISPWLGPFSLLGQALGMAGRLVGSGIEFSERHHLEMWHWVVAMSALVGLLLTLAIILGLWVGRIHNIDEEPKARQHKKKAD